MRIACHTRDGIRLAVAEAGTGRFFLFQHGLCADAAQPLDVFPAGQGWRCVAMECRGHGRSEVGPVEAISLATFADDLVSVLEARSGEPVVLGGISMGAALAMRVAVLRPDLVQGLVLARPAWVDRSLPENMLPNALVGELLDQYPLAEARRRFEESSVARRLAAEAPDNLASLRGFFSREPLAITSLLLRRISADGPGVATHEIAALRVPTLVLGTPRDLVHPLGYVDVLASLIPGARRCVITSKADDRDRYRGEFRAALSSFLSDLRA